MKYLHMDCEMGGRDLKYSLLTAYFIITDKQFKVLDHLLLNVKPDDDIYILSGQGMEVNQINIQQHNKIAIPYKQAKPILFNFLKNNLGSSIPLRLTPVGHGVKGDIQHIIDKLISQGSWEQFCTYHYIDTSVVFQYLKVIGKVPVDIDGSISGLAKHFNVKEADEGQWHNAMFDTQITMKVFQKMVEIGKL